MQPHQSDDRAADRTRLPVSRRSFRRFAAARPLYERALAIGERVLGPEHPATASSLNNLAILLQAQGDPVAGRRLYERALAIREMTGCAGSLGHTRYVRAMPYLPLDVCLGALTAQVERRDRRGGLIHECSQAAVAVRTTSLPGVAARPASRSSGYQWHNHL